MNVKYEPFLAQRLLMFAVLAIAGVALIAAGAFLWESTQDSVFYPTDHSSTDSDSDGIRMDNIDPWVNTNALIRCSSGIIVLLLGVCIVGWSLIPFLKKSETKAVVQRKTENLAE